MDANALTPALPAWSGMAILGIVVVMIATLWRIFSKAGEAGWKCLLPIYGAVVFQRILGRPGWWVLLLFIPVVNIVISLVECFDLARVFGKGIGHALGLIFLGPIFAMWLAFCPAEYVGPDGKPKRSVHKAAPARPSAAPKRKAA